MKERERISILEELMSENLIRLDRLESGQFDLKHGQNVLIRSVNDLNNLVWRNSNDIEVLKSDGTIMKGDIAVLKEDVAVLKGDVAVLKEDVAVLKEGVAVLKEDVAVLKDDVTVVKEDVAYLKENMATKQMFASLLEAMVNGFDRTDKQFARMHDEMVLLRQDVNVLKAR
ncbi:hypothetical protein [Dyadobacter sp. CY347]|uniref:hypothetical protein n=1 Tax=Dyadobacter sp. CY347 TaxID=2909336 RepID=UPI001F1774F8|nr:hypothetical protein [Dyadobacter sp. CY347]MCF2486823.1 hypothetical protein [Dyadobacter sp. CY347]